MSVQQLNENSFIVYFDDQQNRAPLEQLKTFEHDVRCALGENLQSVVAASHSLLVEFNTDKLPPKQVRETLQATLERVRNAERSDKSTAQLEIPVYYHKSVAPDLEKVCAATGQSLETLINSHSSLVYSVLAVGFLPGFAYLGNLPDSLQLPRLATPRVSVPKGSIAIAEQYTGVYPRESPGGWHIIGRTPLTTLQPLDNWHSTESPSVFSVGQRVRFIPITRAGYIDAGGAFES